MLTNLDKYIEELKHYLATYYAHFISVEPEDLIITDSGPYTNITLELDIDPFEDVCLFLWGDKEYEQRFKCDGLKGTITLIIDKETGEVVDIEDDLEIIPYNEIRN